MLPFRYRSFYAVFLKGKEKSSGPDHQTQRAWRSQEYSIDSIDGVWEKNNIDKPGAFDNLMEPKGTEARQAQLKLIWIKGNNGSYLSPMRIKLTDSPAISCSLKKQSRGRENVPVASRNALSNYIPVTNHFSKGSELAGFILKMLSAKRHAPLSLGALVEKD